MCQTGQAGWTYKPLQDSRHYTPFWGFPPFLPVHTLSARSSGYAASTGDGGNRGKEGDTGRPGRAYRGMATTQNHPPAPRSTPARQTFFTPGFQTGFWDAYPLKKGGVSFGLLRFWRKHHVYKGLHRTTKPDLHSLIFDLHTNSFFMRFQKIVV